VTLSASDPDGDCPLSFAVTSAPGHGTLGAIGSPTCSSGVATATVTYTPDAGYTGGDAFIVTYSDGTATSAPANVTLTVAAPDPTVTVVAGADSFVAGNSPGSNNGSSTQLRVDA